VGTVVVDADVLIAFLNPDDAQHDRAVQRLAGWLTEPHRVVVPASVYSEILVAAIRADTADEIDRFIHQLGAEIVNLTRRIAWRAAQLRAQNGALRLRDALVVATAIEERAELLTLDLRQQKV
jgi:predicted nucleic acid-binding protein